MSSEKGNPAPATTLSPTIEARRNIAAEIRALIDALASADLSVDMTNDLARLMADARALVDRAPVVPGYIRRVEGALRGVGPYSELGPFTGDLHIISPSVQLWEDGDKVMARAIYGASCEGAPGIVHGGYLAATLDELLAHVQRGALRMTVALDMAYVAPARLHRELTYSVWIERIEGRKAFVAGAVHDGDILCARAQAVFVAVKPGMLASQYFE
ncbi:MAG: PaaI family thioesterase [Sphingobium sp.]